MLLLRNGYFALLLRWRVPRTNTWSAESGTKVRKPNKLCRCQKDKSFWFHPCGFSLHFFRSHLLLRVDTTGDKCCCLMLVFTCSWRPAAENSFYLHLDVKDVRRDSGWKNPEELMQGTRSCCSSLLEQPAPEQSLASNHLRGNVKWLLLCAVRCNPPCPPHHSPGLYSQKDFT